MGDAAGRYYRDVNRLFPSLLVRGLLLALFSWATGCGLGADSDPQQPATPSIEQPEPAVHTVGLRRFVAELPELSLEAADVDRWTNHIKPAPDEDGWSAIPWRDSLWEAALEARALGKPLFVWSMNGHPKGFT